MGPGPGHGGILGHLIFFYDTHTANGSNIHCIESRKILEKFSHWNGKLAAYRPRPRGPR